MEMTAIGNASATTGTSGITVKTTADGSSVEAGGTPFAALLQTLGLSLNGQGDGTRPALPLMEMLSALASGLSPGAVQTYGGDASNATADATAQTADVQIGEQKLTIDLQDLTILSGDLAALLQQFGAPADLVTVLQERPQEKLAVTLAAHPELRASLGQALTQMVQAAAASPSLVTVNPQVAELMKSLLDKTVTVREDQPKNEGATQATAASASAQPMLGKLQASISTHAVQIVASVNTTEAQASANAQTSAPAVPNQAQPAVVQPAVLMVQAQDSVPEQAPVVTEEQTNGQAVTIALPAQTPVQPNGLLLKAEPTTVTMHADKFHTEFADLVVKRASLLEAPGRHEFRIVLQPQGLGEIEVRVQAQGNQISLQITADSSAAKMLLDSGLNSLKAGLQSQGIQYDRIDISSTTTSNADVSSGLSQERGSSQQQGQPGGQSSRQPRSDSSVFSLDAIGGVEDEDAPDDGFDVTA
jgi:flagellar hook-length control protein FliK